MPVILLPDRWREAPEGDVEIDWGHPSTERLTFAILGHMGALPIDMVRGAPVSIVGSGPVAGAGSEGPAINFTSTGANYFSGPASANLIGTAEAAALIHHQKTDTTNRGHTTFSHDITNASIVSGERFLANAPWSDGVTYFDFGGSAGNNRISAASLDYSRPAIQIFTGALGGLKMFHNGTLAASSTTAVTRSASTGVWGLNYNVSGGTGDLKLFYSHFAWNRDIPLDEGLELSIAPYQFLRRDVHRTYFFPSSGGIQSGAGTADGTSTAPGAGASTAAAAGSAAGTSTADGVGSSSGGVQSGAGSADGAATASGAGAATAASAGSGDGTSTASGVGQGVGGAAASVLDGGGYHGAQQQARMRLLSVLRQAPRRGAPAAERRQPDIRDKDHPYWQRREEIADAPTPATPIARPRPSSAGRGSEAKPSLPPPRSGADIAKALAGLPFPDLPQPTVAHVASTVTDPDPRLEFRNREQEAIEAMLLLELID